jgi:hypothetical protein
MKKPECFIAILFLFANTSLLAQNCYDFYNSAGCIIDEERGYKMYSQSKSVPISANDTIEFNVVFYGQKDYIFTFCTDRYLYPIHFCLLDHDNRDVLYDNAHDKYVESLKISFDVTKSLVIQVNVLADQDTARVNEDNAGCLGLLLQYRKY